MNTEQHTATKEMASPQEERLQSPEQAASESTEDRAAFDSKNEAPPITGSRHWKSLYQAISSYAKDIHAHSKR